MVEISHKEGIPENLAFEPCRPMPARVSLIAMGAARGARAVMCYLDIGKY
jgi:hypothetical protein